MNLVMKMPPQTEPIDKDVEKVYNEMLAMFGDKLPNIDHEPIRFRYYYKLYKLEKTVQERNKQ